MIDEVSSLHKTVLHILHYISAKYCQLQSKLDKVIAKTTGGRFVGHIVVLSHDGCGVVYELKDI